MRFIIPLLLMLGFDYYVFQAFQTISLHWQDSSKQILSLLYWSIPILTLLFLIFRAGLAANLDKHRFSLINSLLIIVYLAKFLIATTLLIDDLRRLFLTLFLNGPQPIDRSLLLSQIGLAFGGGIALTLLYGIFRNPYRYQVLRESVAIDGLPKELNGLRIVQISDVHSGSFTRKLPVAKGIELINQQEADLVFFTGDLVNNIAAEMEPFVEVFDKITAKYGVYSILGNHDYGEYVRWENPEDRIQNLKNLIATHKKMGWEILLNENKLLTINQQQVAIIGVENYSASPRFPKYGKLQEAYQGTETAQLKLLLSHDPSHWKAQVVQQYEDIAITFSGHTHGFQFGIEIPGWFKWSPVKYVYKQWAGLYQEDKQFLYVNRGFGFLGYPGRVGILPEITVIDLKSK